MNNPRIIGIGTANPALRLTQEQSFHAAGYQSERIRQMFLNSDIDHRHFYLEGDLNRDESSDQLNQRYLQGGMKTGCHAIVNCLETAGKTVQEVDFLAVCTCTGYVCPDVGSRLIAHMGFRKNVQRDSIVGLGCAAAVPAETARAATAIIVFIVKVFILLPSSGLALSGVPSNEPY